MSYLHIQRRWITLFCSGFFFLYQLLYISPSMYMIMNYYCIWEKGYHCYSPSVAKFHMLMMLLRYIILCFLAKISTYFSTFDYFFFCLSFFGCLMRWSDWDGLDEEKKARIYFPSRRCHHSCYAEIILVGITRRYLKQNAWISELLSNCLATFREPKGGKIGFLEAMEDWKWDWRQLSSPRLTVCPAHFVFALVSWPHWTGNEREDEEEVLSAGSAKIKLLEKENVDLRKKKKKRRSSWKSNNDKKICLLSDPSVVCRRPETLRYPASLSS